MVKLSLAKYIHNPDILTDTQIIINKRVQTEVKGRKYNAIGI